MLVRLALLYRLFNLILSQVRVHNVLKQQKTKPVNEHVALQEKQEKERLGEVVDQLKSKIHDIK